MKPKRSRACDGKAKHPSKDDAYAHRRSLIAGGAYAPMLRVYRCRFSPPGAPHWHVGHPTGSQQSK